MSKNLFLLGHGTKGDGCRFTIRNQLCYCVCFFALFLTYFVHNVSATVCYDRKELLEIRTAITHPVLEEYVFFESEGKDLLQTPNKALIPVFRRRKRQRSRGRRSGCLVRIWWWVGNLPLPSVLLAKEQSLDHKRDELQTHISYQWDIKNCNVLCFTVVAEQRN